MSGRPIGKIGRNMSVKEHYLREHETKVYFVYHTTKVKGYNRIGGLE